MKSKRSILGMAVILLIVVIPVFLYFNQHGVKEDLYKKQEVGAKKDTGKKNNNSAASVNKEQENSLAANNEKETSEPVKENSVPSTTGSNGGTLATGEEKEVQHDFVVVIDPGHQIHANLEPEPVGPGASETKVKVTGGTSGVATGKPEYKLTLEASLVLGQLLESRGAKVIFTRTTNEVNLSNRERAEIANQNHADLFVRIHADGSTNQNIHGLSVLTPAQNDPYTNAIFSDSLKASQFIADETSNNQTVKVNGISYRSDMSGFNWSKVPCTLIEMGYMTNPAEDRNLSDPAYLRSLLTNVADGIMDYKAFKK